MRLLFISIFKLGNGRTFINILTYNLIQSSSFFDVDFSCIKSQSFSNQTFLRKSAWFSLPKYQRLLLLNEKIHTLNQFQQQNNHDRKKVIILWNFHANLKGLLVVEFYDNFKNLFKPLQQFSYFFEFRKKPFRCFPRF